jgi:iron donor protein CyaY
MSETEFTKLAKLALSRITDTIENVDIDGLIDMDFNPDMIHLDTEHGMFIINKHSAAREIWLASPISGPYHFFYKDDKWQNKDNVSLFDILARELKINFSEV